MNHIAAVVTSFLGALLWRHLHNYWLPFWVGVAIACVALISNRWLPSGAYRHEPTDPPAPQEEQREQAVGAA